jgi:KipI family sensor histidine kinase inhibitor
MAFVYRSLMHRMIVPTFSVRHLGDHCLSLDFGDTILAETGLICLAAAEKIRTACLAGVTDVVPSYTSVAVHYHAKPLSGLPNFQSLSEALAALMQTGLAPATHAQRTIDIPVCYGGEHGPDLSDVAKITGLTEQQVITMHCAPGSMVFMLGFAPGHPYIGIHDPLFALPRRDVPRTVVPAGSVAIANRQSTIYPTRLPGGWHILGATPLKLFDLARPQPTLLLPGDQIRFIPISPEEFDRLAAQQNQVPQ